MRAAGVRDGLVSKATIWCTRNSLGGIGAFCAVSVATDRLTTRLSYAASEVAGQLIFCVISFYLLKFYTDVYGISALAAGSILLFARCVDALDAPLWGILFERTHSRWGKSRPWFLWLCVPFGIFGTLTFVTPNLGPTQKVIYAAVTYVLSSILYTGINTPVTAILAGLTNSSDERVVLTTFRMLGSKGGVLFVNLTIMHAVSWLGGGNDRRGFSLAMPLYALGTITLYLVAFRNLHETVQAKQTTSSARHSFRAFRGNAPWMIIFASSLFFWVAFIARISSAPFFFEYVLHRSDLTYVANSLDLVSLASILLLPVLVQRLSKRTVWALGLVGSVIGQIVIWTGVAQQSVPTVMLGWVLGFLASGMAMAMPFSILSDSVDYGEWKSGVRAAGLLTAVGAAFCLKAGSGLGGAIPAWILAHTHYMPNVEQTATARAGINLSFIWVPACAYAIALVPVLFYARYERMEPQIRQDLETRKLAAMLVSESV